MPSHCNQLQLLTCDDDCMRHVVFSKNNISHLTHRYFGPLYALLTTIINRKKHIPLIPNIMKVSTFVPSQQIITAQFNSATIVLCMEVEKPEDPKLSRKAFMRRTAGVAFSVASAGGFVDFDGHATGCKCSKCSGHEHGLDDHGDGCSCSNCNNGGVGGGAHVLGCQCGNCMRYGPLSAAAYERDVGDGARSADSYAQNQQVRCDVIK